MGADVIDQGSAEVNTDFLNGQIIKQVDGCKLTSFIVT